VIHTVGPIWHDGDEGEPELLASCYRSSLDLADELGARTLAIPAISTGVYGYPPDAAAQIAVSTLRAVAADTAVEAVTLVGFDPATHVRYAGLLSGR
jgi:O-acetyl-ADP-ribose deacetylase (regulator of RNase III)